MKVTTCVFALIISIDCVAGTGHAKDMDITYLLILSLLGLILLIWNSIDYLSKNKEKIKSSIVLSLNRIKEFVRQLYNWKFLNPLM